MEKSPAFHALQFQMPQVGPGSVQNLEIWREAMDIAKAVYRLTSAWPKEESYGITSQLRRAAVSVPTNLAEGIGRGSPAEVRRFAQFAVASTYEMDTLLELSSELGFASPDAVIRLRNRYSTLGKRISSFIAYQNKRKS